MSSRSQQVLALYRRILRAGRTWGGPDEEQHYIFSEAKASFRRNRNVTNSAEVDKLMQEGEVRLEYAVHYGIPYPRLEHASQFRQRYFMEAPQEDASESPPHSGRRDAEIDAKLAAAMARRKAKLQRDVPQ